MAHLWIHTRSHMCMAYNLLPCRQCWDAPIQVQPNSAKFVCVVRTKGWWVCSPTALHCTAADPMAAMVAASQLSAVSKVPQLICSGSSSDVQ
jgi:hypothetical protein